MKHTPGPWKFNGHSLSGNHFNVIGTQLGNKFKIARCPYEVEGDKEEAEANAKLAAAAPELLEALQGVVRMHDWCSANGSPVLSPHLESLVKQAINKATK